jgi:hypothetical protein
VVTAGCMGGGLGCGTHNTSLDLREMFGSAGVLSRPAGCSETPHDRVLGHHQLSQPSSTPSLCAITPSWVLLDTTVPCFGTPPAVAAQLHSLAHSLTTEGCRVPSAISSRTCTWRRRRRRREAARSRPKNKCAGSCSRAHRTAMQNLRNVILGFGTARQKRVFE